MRVTSKGQVTIPIDIRRSLGIDPGAEVEFELMNGEVRMRVVRGQTTSGSEVAFRLRGSATADLSTDETMAETRGSE